MDKRPLRLTLSDPGIRLTTAFAAAFNTFGFLIEWIILRQYPVVPLLPMGFSMGVGAAILTFFLLSVSRRCTKVFPLLFVLNASAVSFALYTVYGALIPTVHGTFPFQACKLGTIVAGLLAPTTLSGLLGIAIHLGTPLFQFFRFPEPVQASLQPTEPWALLAFGMAALFALFHRMRVSQVQAQEHDARVEIEATRRLAKNFIQLRDQINSPVQSIEIAASLIEKSEVHDPELVKNLKRSCARLREIDAGLKQYESQLDWKD